MERARTLGLPVGVEHEIEAKEEGRKARQGQVGSTVTPEEKYLHQAKQAQRVPGGIQPGAELRQLVLWVGTERVRGQGPWACTATTKCGTMRHHI